MAKLGFGFKKIRPDSSIASWALRFVASKEGIITVLIGADALMVSQTILALRSCEAKVLEYD